MSIEKLQEIYQSLDNLEKLNGSTSAKMVSAERERVKEENIQNLLKFELSQLTINLQDEKLKVKKLEAKQDGLVKSQRVIRRLLNLFRYNSFIDELRDQMKAHSMEKVQQKLDALDFDKEARECCPSQTIP